MKRTKIELVNLYLLLLRAKTGAIDEGDTLAARVMGVQIDTLEYVLGVENTKTQEFITAAEELENNFDSLEPIYAR